MTNDGMYVKTGKARVGARAKCNCVYNSSIVAAIALRVLGEASQPPYMKRIFGARYASGRHMRP